MTPDLLIMGTITEVSPDAITASTDNFNNMVVTTFKATLDGINRVEVNQR